MFRYMIQTIITQNIFELVCPIARAYKIEPVTKLKWCPSAILIRAISFFNTSSSQGSKGLSSICMNSQAFQFSISFIISGDIALLVGMGNSPNSKVFM